MHVPASLMLKVLAFPRLKLKETKYFWDLDWWSYRESNLKTSTCDISLFFL